MRVYTSIGMSVRNISAGVCEGSPPRTFRVPATRGYRTLEVASIQLRRNYRLGGRAGVRHTHGTQGECTRAASVCGSTRTALKRTGGVRLGLGRMGVYRCGGRALGRRLVAVIPAKSSGLVSFCLLARSRRTGAGTWTRRCWGVCARACAAEGSATWYRRAAHKCDNLSLAAPAVRREGRATGGGARAGMPNKLEEAHAALACPLSGAAPSTCQCVGTAIASARPKAL